MLPGNSLSEMIWYAVEIYLILTFLLTCYEVIRMYVIKYRSNGVKYGKERKDELIRQGRFKQIPLYSMEEISQKKSRGDARLSVFLSDSQEKRKYVIICPGGGYAHCVTREEGYPVAARFNEMGYTAFVLDYRTRFHARHYAPIKDLAAAVRHIEAHAEEYGVLPEDYAICGFSAGGNMAGVFGSEKFGYKKYGVRKPGALMLAYPWTNINHWLDHPYWNVWKGMVGVWLSQRGLLYLFGFHASKEERESICVQNLITPDYPPTYIMSGTNDILVPASHHAAVLVQALKKEKVTYLYENFWGLPHGIGIAKKTRAEGWMRTAVDFWEKIKDSDDTAPSSN